MFENRIKEKCSKVFNNSSNVEIIKRLELGMSNYMFLISVDDNNYTFRIPGECAEVFVNREIEKKGLDLIKTYNLCGDTIYFDEISGDKIAKYIDGRVLYHNVKDSDYELVASLLHKLHNIKSGDILPYSPFDKLDYYESLNITQVNPKYLELKSKLLGYKEFLTKQPLVLCHNDAQPSNFIFGDDKKMYLLDYEFIGLNDPLYDVACFGNNDINEGRKLLNHYLGRTPSVEEENRFYLWRTFQNLQWVQVALYKHELKMDKGLNLNFKDLSEMFLNNAIEAFKNVR